MAGRRGTPRHSAPSRGHARRRPSRRGGWPRRLVGGAAVLAVVAAVAAAVVTLAPTTVGRSLIYPVHDAQQVEDAARRHGLDPALVCAVIKCESSWDASAESGAGAVGLMQVMPSTAESLVSLGRVDGELYEASNLTDPATNLEFGCAYLEFLEENLSSTEEIVAAYNAGLGAVQGWLADGGSVPEDIAYAETRTYLERVTAAYDGYLKSYPDGITGA